MAFTKAAWKNEDDPDFDPVSDPAISAENLNRIETGIDDAHTELSTTVKDGDVIDGGTF